jgi:co-chaperonin GroES (HSP10)
MENTTTERDWSKLVKAVGTNIIVLPDKPQDKKTEGGIIIPNEIIAKQAGAPPTTGRIIAIGADYDGEYKTGDRVQWKPMNSEAIEHPCGEKLIRLTPMQVLWALPDEQ